MTKAIVSALIVLTVGYFGMFLGLPGGLLAMGAAATGCIVYAIEDLKNRRD